MKYRREIDGLRSVAVLPVIFFHAGLTVFSGGYVGVDIFFVISGYLITSIIVGEQQDGSFTITNFYERRARRILPALFTVILVCVPLAWAWMSPSQLKEFSHSIAAVSIFSSNILFWLESGYFSPAAELKPLLHTWSLAVEEQYYIFFPVYVLVTWRFGKKSLFYSLLLIGFISLLLSQWVTANHPNASFYLLPTRLWELLIGSLIAIYVISSEKKENVQSARSLLVEQWLSILGMTLIIYAIFSFDSATPFPSFYTLVPTVGTALIILFASERTLVSKLLSAKIPVAIGLISYSAYLWHQPLFAFARIRSITEPGHVFMSLLGILSLVLAYFSWQHIEKPFREKSRYTTKKIYLLAAVSIVFFIGLGSLGHLTSGFHSRTMASGDTYANTRLDHRVRINHGLNRACGSSFTLDENCRTSNQPEILIWGDSYAMHLVQGILASKKDAKIIQLTKSVCGPFVGLAPTNSKYPERWSEGCLEFSNSVASWIKENTSIRYAVLSSPFKQFLSDEWMLWNADGILEKNESVVYEYFSSTLEFLLSQGIQPVVFAPPPSLGKEQNIGECLVRAKKFGNNLSECDFSVDIYKERKADVIRFLKKVDQSYNVVWVEDILCDNVICKSAIDDTFVYRDSGHFSHEGSALVGTKMNFYALITAPQE